jgi:hypothetical protein
VKASSAAAPIFSQSLWPDCLQTSGSSPMGHGIYSQLLHTPSIGLPFQEVTAAHHVEEEFGFRATRQTLAVYNISMV